MLLKIYASLEKGIPLAFFFLIFILMSVGVICRYLFSVSFSWNLEACRYGFVWLTFLGAAYVRSNNDHIAIEVLANKLNTKIPWRAQFGLWLFKKAVISVYMITLTILSTILSLKAWHFNSQAMQISQFFLYISVAIGSALFLVREVAATKSEWHKIQSSRKNKIFI